MGKIKEVFIRLGVSWFQAKEAKILEQRKNNSIE